MRRSSIAFSIISSFVLGCIVSATIINTVVVEEGSVAVVFDSSNMITDVMNPGINFRVTGPSVEIRDGANTDDDYGVVAIPSSIVIDGKSTAFNTRMYVSPVDRAAAVKYLNTRTLETGEQPAHNTSNPYGTTTTTSLELTASLDAQGWLAELVRGGGWLSVLEYQTTAPPTTLVNPEAAAAYAANQTAARYNFDCTTATAKTTNQDTVLAEVKAALGEGFKVDLQTESPLVFKTAQPCRQNPVKPPNNHIRDPHSSH